MVQPRWSRRRVLGGLAAFGSGAVGCATAGGRGAVAEHVAFGRRGAVTAGGRTREAADAGVEQLARGGNAADAAATALLALTVVDGADFCFGGEVAILVRDARSGTIETLAGVGAAPGLATIERFAARDGKPARMPADGSPETALVPGALDGIVTLLDRHGTISFAAAAAPTLALLDRGRAPWHRDLARTVRVLCTAEATGGGDRRAGLQRARDAFYRGPIARALDAWARDHGALLRHDDLATHTTHVEPPVSVEFAGHTIWKCGAWTQGPFLLEALRLLQGFDLRSLGRGSAAYAHVVTEAMKLAFADRDAHLGDPRFVDVPLAGLLDERYAQRRRALIDLQRASLEQRPGDPRAAAARGGELPPHAPVAIDSHDTTTCIAADAAGNFVVATPSGWGGVLAGDTGVWLGSRLRCLNLQPGHPNCLAPGKRPRITLTPTLVTRAGEPVLGISVAGGDYQDQVALQLLLNQLVFGLDPVASVSAPRFGTDHLIGSFNQTPPVLGNLTIDRTFAVALGQAGIDDLRARGHAVKLVDAPLWQPALIARDPARGELVAAGDPKAGRKAAALG